MNNQVNPQLCPRPIRQDWEAFWIWTPDRPEAGWRNTYALFRKTFQLSGAATIRIAADTRYELHLDGQRIGRGTAPCDLRYKPFDTYSVTFGAGEHTLAVLVHHIGETCATVMKSRPGLLVEIEAADGRRIGSDASWKTHRSRAHQQDLPCMMSHFGFNVTCDYRLLPLNWSAPDFADAQWPAAEVIGPAGCEPWTALLPADIPPLRMTPIPTTGPIRRGQYEDGPIAGNEKDRTVAVEMAARQRDRIVDERRPWPLRIAEGNRHEFVVIDFGREVTGHVIVCLSGAQAGQRIDLGYDEKLDERGLPNPRRTYVHFGDRFILAQDQQRLEVFDGRGFRFLLIDAEAGLGGVSIEEVLIEERVYPLDRLGSFECSDPELGRLYKIAQMTTRLCMLDSFVDCPSRERVLWMDMFVEGMASAYSLGDTALWRHCLYLFAQNFVESGPVAGAIKAYVPTDLCNVIDTYIMMYVACVKEYVMFSGDLETGRALWPTVLRQLEVLSRYTTPDGLLSEEWAQQHWQFVDWSAMDNEGVSASVNALYIQMHRDLVELGTMLDRKEDVFPIEQKIQGLIEAYWSNFWSPQDQLFIDCRRDGQPSAVRSQTTNLLAILAEVVEGEAARNLMARITDPENLLERTPGDFRLRPDFACQTGGIVPIGTPAMGYSMQMAIWKLGLDQEALETLRRDWSAIIFGDTFAEHFVEDKNTSFCHGWASAPAIILPRFVLGVTPLEPGWRQVAIQPRPGALAWARGTVPTPYGEIRVAWTQQNGQLELHVEAPPQIKIQQPADVEALATGR